MGGYFIGLRDFGAVVGLFFLFKTDKRLKREDVNTCCRGELQEKMTSFQADKKTFQLKFNKKDKKGKNYICAVTCAAKKRRKKKELSLPRTRALSACTCVSVCLPAARLNLLSLD